jgi:hypothetical protein
MRRRKEEAKAGAFAYAWRTINHQPQTGKPRPHSPTPELPQLLTSSLAGYAGFFVKPRGLLLLPDVRVFARDILAGVFSH